MTRDGERARGQCGKKASNRGARYLQERHVFLEELQDGLDHATLPRDGLVAELIEGPIIALHVGHGDRLDLLHESQHRDERILTQDRARKGVWIRGRCGSRGRGVQVRESDVAQC